MFIHRLSPSEHLVLSMEPDNPHLVLTPTHLTCVVVDGSLQQEDVVSKVRSDWLTVWEISKSLLILLFFIFWFDVLFLEFMELLKSTCL